MEKINEDKINDKDQNYILNSNFNQWTDYDKNLKNYIPLEIIDICKNLFNKFSKNTEFIESKDLMNMLRLLDLNPSVNEIENMIKLLTVSSDPNEMKGNLNFHEFVVCVARKRRDSNTIQELISAFKLLDKDGTGKLPEPILRYHLCKKGEVFSNEEMDAFLKEANQYNFLETINDVKYLNYAEFALYLKDLYVPKEEIDPKKTKRGGKK